MIRPVQIKVAHGWVALKVNSPDGKSVGLLTTDTFQIDANGNRIQDGFEQMKIIRLDSVDDDWWHELTAGGVWGGGLFER